MTNIVLLIFLFITAIAGIYVTERCVSMDFSDAFKKTNLIILSFYNNDKKLNFIIDSGSTCSIINKDILKSIKYTDTVIQGVGETVSLEGVLKSNKHVNIQLTHKKQNFNLNFLVMDISKVMEWSETEYQQKIDGILGTDFLNNNTVIDFSKYKLYTKNACKWKNR